MRKGGREGKRERGCNAKQSLNIRFKWRKYFLDTKNLFSDHQHEELKMARGGGVVEERTRSSSIRITLFTFFRKWVVESSSWTSSLFLYVLHFFFSYFILFFIRRGADDGSFSPHFRGKEWILCSSPLILIPMLPPPVSLSTLFIPNVKSRIDSDLHLLLFLVLIFFSFLLFLWSLLFQAWSSSLTSFLWVNWRFHFHLRNHIREKERQRRKENGRMMSGKFRTRELLHCS